MLKGLHDRGIVVAAASSSGTGDVRAKRSGLKIDAVYEKQQCGNKGGGNYVAAFCQDYNIETHECLTVWEDMFGFREGINGRTLSFHAEWGGGISKYGIRLERPSELLEYLDVFFLKTRLWFAKLDTRDAAGRDVIVRALIDGNGAGSDSIKRAAYQTLKERQDIKVHGVSFALFLLTHMLASAYLDGLLTDSREQVLWQIYPGYSPTSSAPPVIQAQVEHLTLFRSKASKKLYGLQRLREAERSHTSRMADKRGNISFLNQVNTIALSRSTDVRERRVYVIDDFTTEGYSLEAARAMFYAAGARRVHLLAFGKYGSRYRVQTPVPPDIVSPYELKRYADKNFVENMAQLNHDGQALTDFVESLQRIHSTTIRDKLLAPSP